MIKLISKWVGLQPIRVDEEVTLSTEDGWKTKFIAKNNFYIKTINFYEFKNEFNIIQGRFYIIIGLVQMTVDK